MKNSKREITLNEKDSLTDMRAIEEQLTAEYLDAVFCCERKETQNFLRKQLASSIDDVLFLDRLQEKKSDFKQGN